MPRGCAGRPPRPQALARVAYDAPRDLGGQARASLGARRYGAKFVLALGVAGLAIIFAGWVFDSRGSFDLLYVRLGAAAIVAAMAGALGPGRRRPVPAPAGAD